MSFPEVILSAGFYLGNGNTLQSQGHDLPTNNAALLKCKAKQRAEPVTTARSAPGAEHEHSSQALHTATVLLQTEQQQITNTEQCQPWQGHRTV